MTELELEDLLAEALDCNPAFDDSDVGVAEIRSFADAGVMTYNQGLVVRCDDGTEFQLTIVRSN